MIFTFVGALLSAYYPSWAISVVGERIVSAVQRYYLIASDAHLILV